MTFDDMIYLCSHFCTEDAGTVEDMRTTVIPRIEQEVGELKRLQVVINEASAKSEEPLPDCSDVFEDRIEFLGQVLDVAHRRLETVTV
ncbi:hypothetical protein [Kistimonas asteriae]|uniref:hypothetical protein n=1 Tax=Kistimonas asteriae TaxID=517724 RepID=UPI001BAA40A9|nr:hypothetical protein [Kistimonas asteriae]